MSRHTVNGDLFSGYFHDLRASAMDVLVIYTHCRYGDENSPDDSEINHCDSYY